MLHIVPKVSPYLDRAVKINEVKKHFNLIAHFQIVLWISTDETISMPAIGFTPKVIAFLNEVGVGINIDTYLNVL